MRLKCIWNNFAGKRLFVHFLYGLKKEVSRELVDKTVFDFSQFKPQIAMTTADGWFCPVWRCRVGCHVFYSLLIVIFHIWTGIWKKCIPLHPSFAYAMLQHHFKHDMPPPHKGNIIHKGNKYNRLVFCSNNMAWHNRGTLLHSTCNA